MVWCLYGYLVHGYSILSLGLLGRRWRGWRNHSIVVWGRQRERRHQERRHFGLLFNSRMFRSPRAMTWARSASTSSGGCSPSDHRTGSPYRRSRWSMHSLLHFKKRSAAFPSPAGMSLTKLYRAGNNFTLQEIKVKHTDYYTVKKG
jgi:hypothetical protein